MSYIAYFILVLSISWYYLINLTKATEHDLRELGFSEAENPFLHVLVRFLPLLVALY